MSIFDVRGDAVAKGYDIFGNAVPALFDIKGNKLSESWDGLSTEIRTMLDTAMAYCADYISENPQAYAFPVIADAHLDFKGNEPKYIEHQHPNVWSKFLFLGDMTNTYDETQLNNAVGFMGGTSLNKIIAIGNHEFGGWEEGKTRPEVWYKPLLDNASVHWDGDSNGMIYYTDDEANNVRYIVLNNCAPQEGYTATYLLPKNQIEWCASAIESADGKDIIICNHTMGTGFYLVSDTEKTTRIYDTTVHNASTLFAMVRAFVQKTSCQITDDNGAKHTHDFSTASGEFIGYFAGHYHNAGHTNEHGFNHFSNPTLGTASSKYLEGMSFFIVDRAQKKIVWLVCRYEDATIATYEYSYE